jgi:hypothetical protein
VNYFTWLLFLIATAMFARTSFSHRVPRLANVIRSHRRGYAKDDGISRPPVPNPSNDGGPAIDVFSFKARTPTNPLVNDHVSIPRRTFAIEQQSQPPPSSSKEPVVETFAGTSKPKPYHGRPPRTDLPLQKVSKHSSSVVSFHQL